MNQKLVDLEDKTNKRFVELEDKTNKRFVDLEGKMNKGFVEVNKRLDTLFNAVIKNTEEDTAQKERNISLNKKVFNHEKRISNLENKILTA